LIVWRWLCDASWFAHVRLRPGAWRHGDRQGNAEGTIAGADFATALFAMWLGTNPVDDGLKDGLLGN